jgi:hypothetical protein
VFSITVFFHPGLPSSVDLFYVFKCFSSLLRTCKYWQPAYVGLQSYRLPVKIYTLTHMLLLSVDLVNQLRFVNRVFNKQIYDYLYNTYGVMRKPSFVPLDV